MVSSPRILTVDPTGNVNRIVRAAVDLMDHPVIMVDMPDGTTALEEINERDYTLLVSALELDGDMKGILLGIEAKQARPDLGVVLLAEVDDPELDEETQESSPFVYLQRPVDLNQFARVISAGLKGEDLLEAAKPPVQATSQGVDLGPMPDLDLEAARGIVDSLLQDLGAMAIILISRKGEVMMERGAVGYLDRDKLTGALQPLANTNVQMKDLVGGQSNTLQFYDGDNYDVFVLSVGLHHFLCLVFDGQIGNRQFGAVNRFGRRAVEDLIALLGATAFFIQPAQAPQPEEARARRKTRKRETTTEEQVSIEQLERASFDDDDEAEEIAEVEIEPEPLLEPIADFDADLLSQLDALGDDSSLDDLFDMEELGEMANELGKKNDQLDYNTAVDIGLLKGGKA